MFSRTLGKLSFIHSFCRNPNMYSYLYCFQGQRLSSQNFTKPVLTMFTKENCSLCDDAKVLLENLNKELMFELQEIDITAPEHKNWFDKYKYDIPVFHLNGEYLMRHKVHESLLTKTLRKLSSVPQNKEE